jgi:hypothetical protein
MDEPDSSLPLLNAADAAVFASWPRGHADDPDPPWMLPHDSPQWLMVQSNVLARLGTASIARTYVLGRAEAA